METQGPENENLHRRFNASNKPKEGRVKFQKFKPQVQSLLVYVRDPGAGKAENSDREKLDCIII
jgi:hypothetical protein